MPGLRIAFPSVWEAFSVTWNVNMPHPTPTPVLRSIHNACKLHGTLTCPISPQPPCCEVLRSIHNACKLHGTLTCPTAPQPPCCVASTTHASYRTLTCPNPPQPPCCVASTTHASYKEPSHAPPQPNPRVA